MHPDLDLDPDGLDAAAAHAAALGLDLEVLARDLSSGPDERHDIGRVVAGAAGEMAAAAAVFRQVTASARLAEGEAARALGDQALGHR
ncbi:hypothetical protein GCM10023215_65700 [Pseudonocardia yuanmonensis]|uniref:Excreted virulence factor EspC, type VII ESX diderm n=1 Tax=Pseudonocardia yuanmonensis TaxID=1095914 RepID=A0ABP8XUS6_9PSEU